MPKAHRSLGAMACGRDPERVGIKQDGLQAKDAPAAARADPMNSRREKRFLFIFSSLQTELQD